MVRKPFIMKRQLARKKNISVAEAPSLKVDCDSDELRLTYTLFSGTEMRAVSIRGERIRFSYAFALVR